MRRPVILLSLLSLLLVGAAVGAVGIWHIRDPFLGEHLAYVELREAGIEPKSDFFWPGMEYLVRALSAVTGLSVSNTAAIPVAAILGFLGAWMLGKRSARFRWLSPLMATVFVLRFLLPYNASIFPHAIGFSMLTLFLWQWAGRTIYGERGTASTLLLMGLFVGLDLYSYTAALWATAIVAVHLILTPLFSGKARGSTSQLNVLWFVICVTLATNLALFGRLVPHISDLSLATSVHSFVGRVSISFLGGGAPALPYAWYPTTPASVLLTGKLWLGLISLPLLIVGYKFITGQLSLRSSPVQYLVTLGGIVLVDVFAYGLLVGFASTFSRTALFLLPLTFTFALALARSREKVEGARGNARTALVTGLSLIIVVTSGVMLVANVLFSGAVLSQENYETTHPMANWFIDYRGPGRLVTDHHTGSELQLVASGRGIDFARNFDYTLLTATDYDALRGVSVGQATYLGMTLSYVEERVWTGGVYDLLPPPEIESGQFVPVYHDGHSILFFVLPMRAD